MFFCVGLIKIVQIDILVLTIDLQASIYGIQLTCGYEIDTNFKRAKWSWPFVDYSDLLEKKSSVYSSKKCSKFRA